MLLRASWPVADPFRFVEVKTSSQRWLITELQRNRERSHRGAPNKRRMKSTDGHQREWKRSNWKRGGGGGGGNVSLVEDATDLPGRWLATVER